MRHEQKIKCSRMKSTRSAVVLASVDSTPEAFGDKKRLRHQPNKEKQADKDRAQKALQKMRAKSQPTPAPAETKQQSGGRY